MVIERVFGVIVRDGDGGDQLRTFDYEEEALEEALNVVADLKRAQLFEYNVYVSELEYDVYRDLIVSDRLVDENSRLIR